MRNFLLLVAVALPLAACFGGGGPSKKEMQAAFNKEAQRIWGMDVSSFKKIECHDMSGGQWRCSFEYGLDGKTHNKTSVFEDQGVSWATRF